MAFQEKKFLDAEGITHLVRLLDEYPNNQVLGTVIDAIEDELSQKYEKPVGGIPASDLEDNYLTEHQDLSNYVQKTDYATKDGNYGLVKINVNKGLTIAESDGTLITNTASDSEIKAGDNMYKPIVPGSSHQATFYSLAKAAGDTTQSQSDNEVGSYTNEAKIAIKNMIGVIDGDSLVAIQEEEPTDENNKIWIDSDSAVDFTIPTMDDVPVESGTEVGSVKTKDFVFGANSISQTASGVGSFAEGFGTTASSNAAHAEGSFTEASAYNSHSEGYYTKATGIHQHVQGKFNIEDTGNIYADIVGNGTSVDERSNAHTLDWSGNAWYAGKVSAGTEEEPAPVEKANDLVTKQYADSLVPQFIGSNVGAKYAGMMLYVDANGNLAPLQLGNGLKIENGVLSVTIQTGYCEPICGDDAICGETICGGTSSSSTPICGINTICGNVVCGGTSSSSVPICGSGAVCGNETCGGV